MRTGDTLLAPPFTSLIEGSRIAGSRSDNPIRVELVGPTAKDYRWQAREKNRDALTDFSIDWEHEQARCPQGQISSSWTPTWTRNQEIIKIKFGFATCGGCPVRSKCTQARQRTLSVRRREAHVALEAARQREQTEEFKEAYAGRAGIERVHTQGTRRMGLRRSRYIGEPCTHLQHVAIAPAMNVCRLYDWLASVSPHSTPLSHAGSLYERGCLMSLGDFATNTNVRMSHFSLDKNTWELADL